MRENIVFDYLLANAWGLPLCRVSVSEDGFVQCQENRENTQGLQLEKAEVDKIKSIVSEHAHIYWIMTVKNLSRQMCLMEL